MIRKEEGGGKGGREGGGDGILVRSENDTKKSQN